MNRLRERRYVRNATATARSSATRLGKPYRSPFFDANVISTRNPSAKSSSWTTVRACSSSRRLRIAHTTVAIAAGRMKAELRRASATG
jgi:hypothetical protein